MMQLKINVKHRTSTKTKQNQNRKVTCMLPKCIFGWWAKAKKSYFMLTFAGSGPASF